MRRWVMGVAIAACLGLGGCATVGEDVSGTAGTSADRPLGAAETACLGAGQTSLPPVDSEQRDLDAPPVARHLRPLIYPQAARDAQATGTVHVRVLVCADGKILDARLVMGAPLLDDSALETARAQAFVPATRGRQPVAAWFDVYVDFELP